MSSSCFKFPGRGLPGGQGRGAAGRQGCGLRFTRALCGMQRSRLGAPAIASSWAVSQAEGELGLGEGGGRRGLPGHKAALSAQCPLHLPGWLLHRAWRGILEHKYIYKPGIHPAWTALGFMAFMPLIFHFLSCFISLLTSPLSREELLVPSPTTPRLYSPFVRSTCVYSCPCFHGLWLVPYSLPVCSLRGSWGRDASLAPWHPEGQPRSLLSQVCPGSGQGSCHSSPGFLSLGQGRPPRPSLCIPLGLTLETPTPGAGHSLPLGTCGLIFLQKEDTVGLLCLTNLFIGEGVRELFGYKGCTSQRVRRPFPSTICRAPFCGNTLWSFLMDPQNEPWDWGWFPIWHLASVWFRKSLLGEMLPF